jgi:hypothetical protein
MKTNKAEDMKKERKESFKTVTVGFKYELLNFNFTLTSV